MIRYAVAMKDGEWAVFKEGEVIARGGLTRSAAIEKVQAMALADAAQGLEVQTLISDNYGLLDKRYYGGGDDD